MHKTEVQKRSRSVQKAIKKHSIELYKFMLPLVILLITSSFLTGRLVADEFLSTAIPTDISTPTPSITVSPTPSFSPSHAPTPSIRKIPYETPIPEWALIKKNDSLTLANIPNDDRMSTPDELFVAMNTFRNANALPTLSRSEVLCKIAASRITNIEQMGKASHEGFEEELRSHFNELANERFAHLPTEVVFYGGPLLGVHIVEWGWDRSLTGHSEAIRDRSYNAGCGWTGPNSAVFIFGER